MFLPHVFVAMLKDFTTKYPFKNMIKYTRRWLVELWIKGWRWDVSLVVTEAKAAFKQRTRNYCRIKMAIFGEASRASIAGFILTVVSFLFQLIFNTVLDIYICRWQKVISRTVARVWYRGGHNYMWKIKLWYV